MSGQTKRWLAAAYAATLVSGVAMGRPMSGSDRIDEIVAHEKSFAQSVEKHGYRQGLLSFIADDGILFMPGPVLGKPMLSAAPDFEAGLKWVPTLAGMAQSGDLAFTTGPYSLSGGGRAETGQYLTVWRRQKDGNWRFVLDRGIEGPIGSAMTEDLKVSYLQTMHSKARAARLDSSGSTSELLEQEAALANASLNSSGAGLGRYLSGQSRLLRKGQAPAFTASSRRALLDLASHGVRYTVTGSDVSAAGDLAFTYGTVEPVSKSGAGKSTFVRLWQKQGGKWRIVLDSLAPLPERRKRPQ